MHNADTPRAVGSPPAGGSPPLNSFGPGTLSRDAFASLVYAAAVRLGTVGLSIAAARRLGSTGAGALGVAFQVVALGSLVATFSLTYGLTQRLSQSVDASARVQLMKASGGLIGILALVTAAVLMVAAPFLARDVFGDVSLIPVLIACGPLTLAAAAYLWVEGSLQGLRRFGALARWGLLVASFDLLLGTFVASWGVVPMLVSRTALRLIATVFAAMRWLKADDRAGSSMSHAASAIGTQPSLRVVALSLLGFAAPTLAAGAVVLLGNTLLRVLLVRSSDLASAGHFQAADSLAQGVTLVPLAAAAAFMPAAAANAIGPGRDNALPFRRAIEQVTGYNLALCLTAIGLAPWVMTSVFGHDFGPARPVFILLVCAYGPVGPSSLFVAWLMGHGRPWTILGMNLLWAVALLLAFQLGLSRWGATGAALASVAAYLVALVGYALVVAPRNSLPWSSHLTAIAITLAALGCGAALQLTPGVPLVLAVGGNLIMAGLVFARWGAPSLSSSGLLPWWSR